jgi:hypothetical protein
MKRFPTPGIDSDPPSLLFNGYRGYFSRGVKLTTQTPSATEVPPHACMDDVVLSKASGITVLLPAVWGQELWSLRKKTDWIRLAWYRFWRWDCFHVVKPSGSAVSFSVDDCSRMMHLAWIDRRFRYVYCLHHQGNSDYGGSEHLWNVGQLVPGYTAQHHRGQSSTYSSAPKSCTELTSLTHLRGWLLLEVFNGGTFWFPRINRRNWTEKSIVIDLLSYETKS